MRKPLLSDVVNGRHSLTYLTIPIDPSKQDAVSGQTDAINLKKIKPYLIDGNIYWWFPSENLILLRFISQPPFPVCVTKPTSQTDFMKTMPESNPAIHCSLPKKKGIWLKGHFHCLYCLYQRDPHFFLDPVRLKIRRIRSIYKIVLMSLVNCYSIQPGWISFYLSYDPGGGLCRPKFSFKRRLGIPSTKENKENSSTKRGAVLTATGPGFYGLRDWNE